MVWSSLDVIFCPPDYVISYAINVTAYLSGYTKQICLKLNLYFQHIKKLLQSKKVT